MKPQVWDFTLSSLDDDHPSPSRTAQREDLSRLYTETAEYIVLMNEVRDSVSTQCAYAAGRAINKLVRLAVPIENRLDTRGLDVYQRQKILKNLEDVCKEAKWKAIKGILSSCTKGKCRELLRSWGQIGCNDGVLPFNSGDACPNCEFCMCVESQKHRGIGKSTMHSLSEAARRYPPHSVFGTGTGGLAQPLVHNNLFGVTKCLPFSDKLPQI